MPEMSGVEAARQIKSQVPEVRVLVLTANDDDPLYFRHAAGGSQRLRAQKCILR